MRRISAATTLLLATGSLTALGVSPAAAAGVTVSISGSTITVEGTAAADSVTVTMPALGECDATACEVMIAGSSTTPVAPCTQYGGTATVCETSGYPTVNVNLGAGNDSYETDFQGIPQAATVRVDAGPGNDTLVGSGPHETWLLGEGNDTLSPDEGLYESNAGPDDISGGPGMDAVDYLFTPAADVSGKTISFDDVANDTSDIAADVDNVRTDVEQVGGTNEDDTITGNDLPQIIGGSAGNDTIASGGGDDTVDGGGGADVIDAGAGADTIYGGPDNDTITGGPGYDTINGDSTNLLLTGNDTINSLDGEADYVACGPGSDSVTADTVDQIAAQAQDNCESVTKSGPPAPVPPTPTTPTPPGATTVKVSGKKLDADQRRKKASIKVACASATGCIGKVVVKKGKQVVAKGTYAVPAGKTGKVAVKLTKKGRALLRKKKSVKVVVTLTPGGSSTVKLTR